MKPRQLNVDLYLSSINIATETIPHSQSSDINHFKKSRNEPHLRKVSYTESAGTVSQLPNFDFGLEFIQSSNFSISLDTRSQIFGVM